MSTPPLRIASLVPSLTELLVELGLKPWLVARTGYCIHPAGEVVDIPKVGGTKTVNLQKLRRLAPSHVLVNVDENERPTVEALRAFVPHVVVTHPGCAQDNLGLIDQIVAAMPIGAWSCALATRAERWKAQIQAHLAPIRSPSLPGSASALPDLARPMDDGGAGHLHLSHAGPGELADAA
jgi:ABC-type Fe3+-hydroxamate transport system substrate-binding protein